MTTTTMIDGPSVIVTGFHRSGTSAAARLLSMAGVDMGVDLIGSGRSNPFGHFEDRRFVGLHDRWLAASSQDWMVDRLDVISIPTDAVESAASLASSAQHEGVWGFKDPRASFFLDVWAQLPSPPLVVVMFRHPAAAIESLLTREARRRVADGVAGLERLWEPGRPERMWVTTYESILKSSTDRMLFVSFEELAAGFDLVSIVADRIGTGLRDIATFEAVTPRFGFPVDEVPDACEAVYRQLRTLEAGA